MCEMMCNGDFIKNLAPLWVEMSAHQLFENQW